MAKIAKWCGLGCTQHFLGSAAETAWPVWFLSIVAKAFGDEVLRLPGKAP
jgi:hypothetical protein